MIEKICCMMGKKEMKMIMMAVFGIVLMIAAVCLVKHMICRKSCPGDMCECC